MYWRDICYGGDKFVAIAGGFTTSTTKASYSSNGLFWQTLTMPVSAYWSSICYGNNKFVAVSTSNSNIAAYSEDGITWTKTDMPTNAHWSSVTYGDGKFVAVSSNDSNKAAYSEDGITWMETTLPAVVSWQSVRYGDDKFVAIAGDDNDNKQTQSDIVAYSTDGINWYCNELVISQNGTDVTESVANILGVGKVAEIPDHTHDEYITDEELTAKGYLTSIPEEYVTETELDTKLSQLNNKELILASSTPNSNKKFKITIDDNGVLTTTEVIE
jgi:hypothetical protein